MIRLRAEEELNNYRNSINKNTSFMMGSLNEEVKYIAHNKKRFIHALKTIDHFVRKFKRPIRILDIGTSPFTFILQKRYKNAKIYSIDYTNRFEKLCKAKKINFRKVDLNKQDILFGKRRFDLVTFLEVLEHLKTNHKKVIENVIRVLSVKGFCVLQTPNKYSPKAIVATTLSDNVWNKLSAAPKKGDEFVHVKEYSLDELVRMIDENKNLRIVNKEHTMYFDEIDSALAYRKFIKIFTPLVKVNYFVVSKVPFLRRGMQIVFQKIN